MLSVVILSVVAPGISITYLVIVTLTYSVIMLGIVMLIA